MKSLKLGERICCKKQISLWIWSSLKKKRKLLVEGQQFILNVKIFFKDHESHKDITIYNVDRGWNKQSEVFILKNTRIFDIFFKVERAQSSVASTSSIV